MVLATYFYPVFKNDYYNIIVIWTILNALAHNRIEALLFQKKIW